MRQAFTWLSILLTCVLTSQAADYFVATNGADTNTGTSIESPFRTIGAAASIMSAGDTCYIRQGTYPETIAPSNSGTAGSPIVFMPYNSETVTVSAADEITGWSLYSNSIYVTGISWDLGAGFNQVFANGFMVNEARWPNTGTNLLSPTLSAGTAAAGTVTFSVSRNSNYWVGGTVYGCFGSKWTSQGATITASTAGGILTVTDKTGAWYTGAGNGYITGIFGELDSAGEWFLSGTNLYLWAPGSADPATMTVTAKRRKWCVNLSGKSHIKVKGLSLLAGSIRMDADNCEVSGCTARYLSHFTKYTWGGMDAGGDMANGNNGVWLSGTANIISNCTFRYSAGSGIVVYGASNLVTRCIISEIDYSGTYSCPLAIKNSTGGNKIHFNTMYNTGRDVLQLYGATADEIFYNNFYNAGKLCADLGITYQWGRDGQGTRIAFNWIHGNLTGGPGIYNDNYSRGFIEDHNVIWDCGGDAGIRLNTPCDAMQIYNNTLFNCGDVGTSTYNCYPASLPGWWTYGNVANSTRVNNLFLGSNPSSQLSNYAACDFTLKTGAAAVDSGSVVSPYTDGYIGSAPDKGAYETGRSQWTAGHNGTALQPLTIPRIRTDPASGVALGTATLNGTLTATGAAPTEVFVLWGPTNGLQIRTNWSHEVPLGIHTGSIPLSYSTNLSCFTPDVTCYYTYFASNAYGEAWGEVESFVSSITQSMVFSTCIDVDIKPDGTRTTNAASLVAGNDTPSTGPDRRVFMKFDLTGLATNWSIQGATLRLYHVAGANDDYGNAVLYPVTNAWTAGTVTYTHPVDTGHPVTIVGNSGPFNEYKNVDVTSSVRQYQANTNSQHGFSIRGTEGFTVTAKYFTSSEGTSGQRPCLNVTYIVPDSNSNNVADTWEWTWFTNLTTVTASSDSDRDGATDYAEYRAGTNPTDPGSRFAFSNMLESADTWRLLYWHSATGKAYTISRTVSLMSNWTNVATGVTATPPVNVYTDATGMAESTFFYRIMLEN